MSIRVLLVCGSRHWTDREACRYWLGRIAERHGTGIVLVHGDCRGADRIAAEEGVLLGFKPTPYGAAWLEHVNCRCRPSREGILPRVCPAAGPVR